MIYIATIYQEVYDFDDGFWTLRKVATVSGSKEEILETFHKYLHKNPSNKYHYVLE